MSKNSTFRIGALAAVALAWLPAAASAKPTFFEQGADHTTHVAAYDGTLAYWHADSAKTKWTLLASVDGQAPTSLTPAVTVTADSPPPIDIGAGRDGSPTLVMVRGTRLVLIGLNGGARSSFRPAVAPTAGGQVSIAGDTVAYQSAVGYRFAGEVRIDPDDGIRIGRIGSRSRFPAVLKGPIQNFDLSATHIAYTIDTSPDVYRLSSDLRIRSLRTGADRRIRRTQFGEWSAASSPLESGVIRPTITANDRAVISGEWRAASADNRIIRYVISTRALSSAPGIDDAVVDAAWASDKFGLLTSRLGDEANESCEQNGLGDGPMLCSVGLTGPVTFAAVSK